MAYDGAMPTDNKPCAAVILKYGRIVCTVRGFNPTQLNSWVKEVEDSTNSHIDWQIKDGEAVLYHYGDGAVRAHVLHQMKKLKHQLLARNIEIMSS